MTEGFVPSAPTRCFAYSLPSAYLLLQLRSLPAYTWRKGKGESSRPAIFPAATVARGCSTVLFQRRGIDQSAATRTGGKSRRTPGSRNMSHNSTGFQIPRLPMSTNSSFSSSTGCWKR